MDQLTLLSRTREHVAAPDPEALARARARLLERAASSRRPHRPATRVLLVAVAASVVTVGAGSGWWPGDTPTATAATVLHRAAGASGADPVTGPGQYLAVETHENALGYVTDDDSSVIGAYLTRTVSVTYVPHEQDRQWEARTWSLPPTTVFGGAAVRAAADRDYAESAHADRPDVERAFDGSFGNGELGGDSDAVGTGDLATMPRDPHRLLSYLESSPGASTGRGDKVLGQVSTLLRSGLVPRDLRSAMFEALALLPDVQITDDQASLEGRTGTAIGVRLGGSIDAVVIDTSTGTYLGQRQVQVGREGAVPDGTVMDQTSVELSVVDQLPDHR